MAGKKLKRSVENTKVWMIERWVKTSVDGIRELRDLFEELLDQLIIEDTNYYVDFQYKNYRDTLQVRFVRLETEYLLLMHCSVATFSADNIKGSIQYIYKSSGLKGSDVLDFTMTLFKKLDVNNVELSDVSQVYIECPDETNCENWGFPLWLYHILVHGCTWYEKFGFDVYLEKKEKWEALVRKVKDLNLGVIYDELSERGKNSFRGIDRNTKISTLIIQTKEKEKTETIINLLSAWESYRNSQWKVVWDVYKLIQFMSIKLK